ncbi:hypothetical protein B7463_g11788, partial [Scytalidium lignicola]
MPSAIATTTTPPPPAMKVDYQPDRPPQLDERFSGLKRDIIKPEHEAAVIASYERLKIALAAEAERIAAVQRATIPECPWEDVVANGGRIPEKIAEQAKIAGCILFRGLMSEEQSLSWKEELIDYTKRHSAVRGRPLSDPTTWLLYWTRPQVQARSHPRILEAMNATSHLWNITDETLPIDLSSQVASCYQPIFEGRWEDYDPWCMDQRRDAKVDLYRGTGSCSGFRSFQGWLSMSKCGPGEGTLRVLPNIKLVTAYLMLRPFFLNESFDASEPTFPGAIPGKGQFYVTSKYYPHLEQDRTIISIPKVQPGDFIYWHTDLLHEVEDENNGPSDSSVLYVANVPLCPYNIQNMLNHRKAFREAVPPPDYLKDFGGPYEVEAQHDDHGAREENILTVEGKRALGLAEFDENEPGLTEGQRKIREMANEAMRDCDACRKRKICCVREPGHDTCALCRVKSVTCQFKSIPNARKGGSSRSPVSSTPKPRSPTLTASQRQATSESSSTQNKRPPLRDVLPPSRPTKQWISQFVGSSVDQDPFILRHCSFNDLNLYKRDNWACLRLVPDSHLDARPWYYPKESIQDVVQEDPAQLLKTFFEIIHTSFPLLDPAQVDEKSEPSDLLLAVIYEISNPYYLERTRTNDMSVLDWIFQAIPCEMRYPKLETIEASLLFLQRHARYHSGNYNNIPVPTTGIRQFLGMVALTIILSDILTTFYSVRSGEKLKTYGPDLLHIIFEQFQKRLHTFHDQYLSQLQDVQEFLDPTGTIFLAYYTVLLALYKAGLRNLSPSDLQYHIFRQEARKVLSQVISLLQEMTVRRFRAFWWSQMSNINFAMAGGFMMSLLLTSVDDADVEYWTTQIKLYRDLLQSQSVGFHPTKLAAARMRLLCSVNQDVLDANTKMFSEIEAAQTFGSDFWMDFCEIQDDIIL